MAKLTKADLEKKISEQEKTIKHLEDKLARQGDVDDISEITKIELLKFIKEGNSIFALVNGTKISDSVIKLLADKLNKGIKF